MFVLLIKYVKPSEEVDRLLKEHIQYLEKYYQQGKFICSGRRNPRTGGVILANADTVAEIKEIISEDPFLMNKVGEYEIIEFTPTKYSAEFASFVK